MAGKAVTRADLCDAASVASGLPRHEPSALVEQVLLEIGDALVRGELVKLSGFGVITVRDKAGRVGRNPKIGGRGSDRTTAGGDVQRLRRTQGACERGAIECT